MAQCVGDRATDGRDWIDSVRREFVGIAGVDRASRPTLHRRVAGHLLHTGVFAHGAALPRQRRGMQRSRVIAGKRFRLRLGVDEWN